MNNAASQIHRGTALRAGTPAPVFKHSDIILCGSYGTESSQFVIGFRPFPELLVHLFDEDLERRKKYIVNAVAPGAFPNSFDRVEFWTVGRQVIQGEVRCLRCAPRRVELGVVVFGVVADDDHATPSLGADRMEILQKRPERGTLEHASFLLKETAAVTQPYRSEIADAFTARIMPNYWIGLLPRHPHPAARTMLAEMDLVQGPQI
jgi:hypothetical protein